MALVKLYHPEYEGLSFGPNNDIVFGLKGGNAPHYAIVDEDNPMLDQLLAKEPRVEIVTEIGPSVVYGCPFHPDLEFKTKGAMERHMKVAKHIDASPAEG